MSATIAQQNDPVLLSRFVREGCQASFAELVGAHQAMVLGTALRRTGDVEMARDVAQQVFALLARKAAWLAGRDSITGWLHHAASFLAARAVRCEARSRARHAELAKETEARIPGNERWAALEDALASLAAAEREALLLHYFEDRSYSEMAAQSGLSEAAIRKRVSRAMQSLGERLRRSGMATSATGLIAGAAALQATIPAHAGLAAAALTAGGTAAPALLTFTALMSHTAAKIAAAAILLAAVPLAITYQTNSRLRSETAKTASSAAAASPVHKGPTGTHEDAAPAANNPEVLAVWKQLTAEHTRRKSAEEKVAELTKQIEQAESEVVVSFGQAEEMAMKLAAVTRKMEELDALENLDAAKKRAGAEEMAASMATSIPEIFMLVPQVSKIESDPEKAGRFYATFIGELGTLDLVQREAIATAVAGRFKDMRDLGLTAEQRPKNGNAAWTASRKLALANMQGAIFAVLPEEKRDLTLRGRITDWFDQMEEMLELGVSPAR